VSVKCGEEDEQKNVRLFVKVVTVMTDMLCDCNGFCTHTTQQLSAGTESSFVFVSCFIFLCVQLDSFPF
jgi:hypothetical protein